MRVQQFTVKHCTIAVEVRSSQRDLHCPDPAGNPKTQGDVLQHECSTNSKKQLRRLSTVAMGQWQWRPDCRFDAFHADFPNNIGNFVELLNLHRHLFGDRLDILLLNGAKLNPNVFALEVDCFFEVAPLEGDNGVLCFVVNNQKIDVFPTFWGGVMPAMTKSARPVWRAGISPLKSDA